MVIDNLLVNENIKFNGGLLVNNKTDLKGFINIEKFYNLIIIILIM